MFVGNKPFSDFSMDTVRGPSSTISNTTFDRLMEKGLSGELHRLDQVECMKHYARTFQTKYGSVLLVSDDYKPNTTDFDLLDGVMALNTHPYHWICSGKGTYYDVSCREYVNQLIEDPRNWTVFNFYDESYYKVDYCLGEETIERCMVEYSLPLCLIVIAVNVIKAAILWGITINTVNFPILTTGDAIASFMKRPDGTTKGKCLLSYDLVGKQADTEWEFNAKPRRWGSAVSRRRWIVCLTSYVPLLKTAFAL